MKQGFITLVEGSKNRMKTRQRENQEQLLQPPSSFSADSCSLPKQKTFNPEERKTDGKLKQI
jgi:hypothetical protein